MSTRPIFLRLSRHEPSQSARRAVQQLIAPFVEIVTVDIGAFGPDPTAQIRAAVAKHKATAVEVIGPKHVLDSLGDLGAPRYCAVMARGADGRVIVEVDEYGVPQRDAAGRDVLCVRHYERAESEWGLHLDEHAKHVQRTAAEDPDNMRWNPGNDPRD